MDPLPILYVQNQAAVTAVVLHYKAEVDASRRYLRSPDLRYVTAVDWAGVLTKFVASVVDLFANTTADPAQKRAAAVQAVMQFYRDVVAPMVAAAIGRPLLFAMLGPVLERLLPQVAGGLYDAIVQIFARKAGGAAPPASPPAFEPY